MPPSQCSGSVHKNNYSALFLPVFTFSVHDMLIVYSLLQLQMLNYRSSYVGIITKNVLHLTYPKIYHPGKTEKVSHKGNNMLRQV